MNASSSENMRLFFALWPDDTTRTALTQLQIPLRGRIVPYRNLHLTLAFLGLQPAQAVEAGKDILLRLSAQPPILTLDRVGYFSRNRVAWAGTHDLPPDLLALHGELGDAVARHGIVGKDHQTFKPHITLARDAAMPVDMAFAPIQWRAAQVVLVRSRATADGAGYEVLASRSLDEKVWIPDEDDGGAVPP
jgi:2'-5' RNA ligase